MTASWWLYLALSLCKTPLGETGCLGNPYFFTYWLPKHPVFWFTSLFPTQSVRLPLFTYPSLCSTCVTYRMTCHCIVHQLLPTQPLTTEAEDFPRGERHFKHVPPLTYLIYLSQKRYIVRFYLRVRATENKFYETLGLKCLLHTGIGLSSR